MSMRRRPAEMAVFHVPARHCGQKERLRTDKKERGNWTLPVADDAIFSIGRTCALCPIPALF